MMRQRAGVVPRRRRACRQQRVPAKANEEVSSLAPFDGAAHKQKFSVNIGSTRDNPIGSSPMDDPKYLSDRIPL